MSAISLQLFWIAIVYSKMGTQGSNYTALMIASQQGNYNAVDILLKYGGDIASVDNVS